MEVILKMKRKHHKRTISSALFDLRDSADSYYYVHLVVGQNTHQGVAKEQLSH